MFESLTYKRRFEEIYTGHYTRLYYYALHIVNDESVAKDIEKVEPPTEQPKPTIPEAIYNILLLSKITNAQKSDILNVVSKCCRSGYKLSPSALNNILKAKKHTIPVEDTQENVKTIIDALKQKKIAASAVKV